jgi:hypothetical protein
MAVLSTNTMSELLQCIRPVVADIVAKVGNCLVIIFPLKVDTSDDRRSL